MKRHGYVFEQVANFGALRKAALRAARGKRRVPEVAEWMLHLESEVLILERELNEGRYVPGSFRVFAIYEKKPRRICAAPFRDRVVHHALSASMEPVLESYAIHHSYACRKDKGSLAALQQAQRWSQQGGYVLKLDVRKFFDSISHECLKGLLHRKFKDRRWLGLCEQIIDHQPPDSVPGKGLPIGNLTSQHWANFYLGALDHWIKETLGISRYLRYMDDMLLWHEDKDMLWMCCREIQLFLEQRLQLCLHPDRTVLAPVSEGISFLGFRVWPSLIRMSHETKIRFLRNIRHFWKNYQEDEPEEASLLATAHSLLGHISHANTYRFRLSVLGDMTEEEDAIFSD